MRRTRLEELQKSRKKTRPLDVCGYGFKIYSQSDEDGILREIFRRIGVTNKIFVEIGAGDGLENNTASLLIEGWSGLWIEGSGLYCRIIRKGLSGLIASGRLHLINDYVNPDNIDELIEGTYKSGDIDLLSVDIDGNDSHVIAGIKSLTSRVIVVEYNAKYGPTINWCMNYSETHVWAGSDNFSASLKFWELFMGSRGYSLVACNLVGVNAFFVRNDLLGDHFNMDCSSEYHYEPARYELTGLPSGHMSSYSSFHSIMTNYKSDNQPYLDLEN